MISAKVIEDSVSAGIPRLITLQLHAPKFLDAEFEKHRMISSNSSSDRAVPVDRSCAVEPFIPTDIRKAGKGMQNAEQVEDYTREGFTFAMRAHHAQAVDLMYYYRDRIHKQHLNRLLLPFAWQHKVATATYEQWMYFLGLRETEHADPAMQTLASAIRKAIHTSEPTYRGIDQWHLPYVTAEEREQRGVPFLAQISAARCARVSYANHDGTDATITKDLTTVSKLMDGRHWTPFEHQAYPIVSDSYDWPEGVTHVDRKDRYWSANFLGWIQYRKLLDKEDTE